MIRAIRLMEMILLWATVAGAGATLTGCGIFGALQYALSPEQKRPAEYSLEKRPTLVLVENFENPALYEVAAARIQRDITAELTENKAASKFITTEQLEDLRNASQAAFRKMEIPAVGKTLGAEQVIYVDLVQFSIDRPIGGLASNGIVVTRVKVVDTATGRTLWPPDTSAGREVRFETKYGNQFDNSDPAVIESRLYTEISGKIAKLFYAAPDENPGVDEMPE